MFTHFGCSSHSMYIWYISMMNSNWNELKDDLFINKLNNKLLMFQFDNSFARLMIDLIIIFKLRAEVLVSWNSDVKNSSQFFLSKCNTPSNTPVAVYCGWLTPLILHSWILTTQNFSLKHFQTLRQLSYCVVSSDQTASTCYFGYIFKS